MASGLRDLNREYLMNNFKQAALAVLLTGVAALADAQTFPDKPVRVIIPYAPGGGLQRHTSRHRR